MAANPAALAFCIILLSAGTKLGSAQHSAGTETVVSIEPRSATVRHGESVSFRCQTQGGGPSLRLEWKKSNNQPLGDNVKVGPDGSVLTIANARPGNQGTYRCVATSAQGKSHSMVSLTVKQSPKIQVTPGSEVRVRVGEPINLECHATGRPRPSVSWYRIDRARETPLGGPASTGATATVQVLSAGPKDTGLYVCRAQSSEGSAEAKVDLTVEGGPQGATPPHATVAQSDMVVVEGQTVTLHCQATGFPTPTITWSKLRAPLPWLHKVQDSSLTLQNVGRQDSGQYICNATSAAGAAEATIQVEVESPPFATCLPDQLRVRAGDPIHLQCLANGTPPIRFQWSRLRGSLPAGAETRGGSLLISQSRVADAGTYKCVASNKLGSSEAQAKVTVRSA